MLVEFSLMLISDSVRFKNTIENDCKRDLIKNMEHGKEWNKDLCKSVLERSQPISWERTLSNICLVMESKK